MNTRKIIQGAIDALSDAAKQFRMYDDQDLAAKCELRANELRPLLGQATVRANARLLAALERVTLQLAHEHPNDEAWIEARAAIAEAQGVV